ncbi:class A beta-lactamase-related serine hydrolase [Sphingomonas donggukensis]|uniref:beta-lactamase n=1 Tax=Sphingomonas donggukensis TaxID=2949093 RepID=A0ABY4TZI3_9SPHN|nr:serine hydrolase [Sphingomonas donggukensis]URW75733.1 class A beta-lactamase-related serine hydrolase [Sphingomonas donggukensis]
MSFLSSFSTRQRSITLAGLAPLALIGAGVHTSVAQQNLLPQPTYQSLLPVPQAAPRTPAPAALQAGINALRDQFDGLAGVAVRSIDDGWAIDSVDADRRMPQQSVSKLWVAMTVLDQIDSGRLTLDSPVTIRPTDLTLFHQPVASLVAKDGVYNTTVRDLLNRAMTQSDNTANDSLLRTVGGPTAVRAFITKKSLGNIRFGPGERLLQSKTAGLTWRQDMAMGRAFEAARARLPAEVRQTAYQSYVSDPPDGASPSAIASALARLKKGMILSPTSTDYLMRTMESSKTGKYRMRGAVPPGWSFGHKTGTGQDLLGRTAGYNDVGFLIAPDGRSYALAIMIGDTRRPIQQRQLLMQGVVAQVVANHRSTASYADR